MRLAARKIRLRLSRWLQGWAESLRPDSRPAPESPRPPLPAVDPATELAALCPSLREPLSVETAVLSRDLSVLKREACDSLAALAAAHALVTSARLAQVQEMRPHVADGDIPAEALAAVAADYQGWQSDQVRLFDALGLVVRMRVPQGKVLDQVDPALHEQARSHLEALSLEYQRGLLQDQFRTSS